MKNFIIFLKNFVFKNISVILLLIVIIAALIDFNSTYYRFTFNNVEFSRYFEVLSVVCGLLLGFSIVKTVIDCFRNKTQKQVIRQLLTFEIIMVIILFLMLCCLNELWISNGYGCVTGFMSFIHYENQTVNPAKIVELNNYDFYNYTGV